uniref:Uncharacterized protein n=1 Tax=Glossina austeni TaxID=7395 RepID=A0A1A9V9P0_GLOAU
MASTVKPNSTCSMNKNTIQEIYLVKFNEELVPLILAARSVTVITSTLPIYFSSNNRYYMLCTTTSVICKRETKSDAHTSSNFTITSGFSLSVIKLGGHRTAQMRERNVWKYEGYFHIIRKRATLLTYETCTEKYSDKDCSYSNRSLLSNEVAVHAAKCIQVLVIPICRNHFMEESTIIIKLEKTQNCIYSSSVNNLNVLIENWIRVQLKA